VAKKIKFTIASIEALEPTEKRAYYYDEKTPNLAVSVTPAGSKAYYFIKKQNGAPVYVKLGSTREIKPTQAQERARKIAVEFDKGHNPNAEKASRRNEMTVGQMHQVWMDERAIGPNPAKPNKRSWKKDEQLFTRHLAKIASKRLSQLNRQTLRTLFNSVTKNSGPVEANPLIRYVRAMFNYVIKEHGIELPNPAAGFAMNAETRRERWVKPEQMPALLAALDQEESDARDLFKLCVFTGIRSGNVKAMSWQDLDLERGNWTISSAHHKNKQPHTVPLTPVAIEIIKSRRGFDRQWVFPSPTSKKGHISEPKGAWARVRTAMALNMLMEQSPARAGRINLKELSEEQAKRLRIEMDVEDLKIHDLRHTAASWMINQGVSLYVVGKVLGHTTQVTTARYAHLAVHPVRSAIEQASKAMVATTKRPTAEEDEGA